MAEKLSAPVISYLEQFERCLKSKSGVVPEDALVAARLHLERDYQQIMATDPDLSADEVFDRLVVSYGAPAEVAAQFEEAAQTDAPLFTGYAPGWRIYCPKCGRSAPLAKTGAVRIGARSTHKYLFGWCRGCNWFRWLRVERDLDDTNLTKQLESEITAE